MTWSIHQTLDVHDERGDIVATAATTEAAARIVAMAAGWQPIETAPKNDTIILTDGGYYIAGFWQEGRGWLGGWSDDTMIMEVRLEPTHWMPLPEPPALAIIDGTEGRR